MDTSQSLGKTFCSHIKWSRWWSARAGVIELAPALSNSGLMLSSPGALLFFSLEIAVLISCSDGGSSGMLNGPMKLRFSVTSVGAEIGGWWPVQQVREVSLPPSYFPFTLSNY